MPPQDIPTEVKSCKAIADDKERLRCFDGLFGGPSKPQKTTEEEQVKNPPEEEHANWSIDETKSPRRPRQSVCFEHAATAQQGRASGAGGTIRLASRRGGQLPCHAGAARRWRQ